VVALTSVRSSGKAAAVDHWGAAEVLGVALGAALGWQKAVVDTIASGAQSQRQ
jgi:hypothetical protein